MSYQKAKANFDDNLKILGAPATNMLMWNLSAGLGNLAQALEDNLRGVEREMDSIRRRLNEMTR